MEFTGDDHELEHGDIDGHDGKGPGAEEGDTAATVGETTEVSLVPRSTGAQAKSSKKTKKRKGFKPQKKVKPKKPSSSSNKTNKPSSSTTDEVAVSADAAEPEVEADAGKLKPPPPPSATEGSELETRKDGAGGIGGGDKEQEAGRQHQTPSAQEGKDASTSRPQEDDGERGKAAEEQNESSIIPAAASTTIQRRQRSDSVASTATTSSRKRTASTIRVGASRGVGGRNKSGGVRFRPLPSSAASRQGGETGAANETTEPSRALVSIEAGATSEPTEQQEALGEDAPPTPSSTALVAAAEAAHSAADQATLHDREILEKLALESADQPRLGMFCSQFKRPKRKKEDEGGTNTKKKRRKKRKKKHDDDNNPQQPTENNENRDPATTGNDNQNIAGTAGTAASLGGGNSSDRNGTAIGTGDTNTDSQPSGRDGDGDAQAPPPAPAGIPAVHVVDGQIVLQESSLVLPVRRTIREVEEEFHDNVVEEDAQPAIVNASYSSFRTKRGATEIVKKGPSIWSAKETYEFFQALRMLGTDFGAMEAMFDGKRTRRQLKLKYKCELARNPELVEKLTDPRFKEPLDMSKFEDSADQGLIENSNQPDHEPTDAATLAAAGDGNNVDKDGETAPLAAGQERAAPAFQPEEVGGDYLEVVEEDAEEERLAAIEKSKTGEDQGGAATRKTAPSEFTETAAKKPKATKKRAARKPVARKTRKSKTTSKEKEKTVTEVAAASGEVTETDSSKKQTARKPVTRKPRKSKPTTKEKEKISTELTETDSSPKQNPGSETVQNDIGPELEDNVIDDLLEGDLDMPMGDEEEQAKTSSTIKSKKSTANSKKKAAAAAFTGAASSKKVSASTNETPAESGDKVTVIQKKGSAKAKRRRPRPLPVKKMKT